MDKSIKISPKTYAIAESLCKQWRTTMKATLDICVEIAKLRNKKESKLLGEMAKRRGCKKSDMSFVMVKNWAAMNED